jgi:hypothetical protein
MLNFARGTSPMSNTGMPAAWTFESWETATPIQSLPPLAGVTATPSTTIFEFLYVATTNRSGLILLTLPQTSFAQREQFEGFWAGSNSTLNGLQDARPNMITA